MNDNVLNEAVENIALIKGVIEQTKKSFAAFSKIFIYWGILFACNSVITFLMLQNKDKVLALAMRYPILHYVFPTLIIALFAALVYRHIVKKIPLVGLEKRLMKVWLLILVMNVIPTKIGISSASSAIDMSTVTIHVNNLSLMLFSLATALIVTSLFTGYKQLGHVAAVYVGITILHAYFNLPFLNDVVIQLLYLLALPVTFLYTGFYLKSQNLRGA